MLYSCVAVVLGVMAVHSILVCSHCVVCCVCVTQAYLKEFNEFLGELQEKEVGVFAVCAESQELANEAAAEWELNFPVSLHSERNCRKCV